MGLPRASVDAAVSARWWNALVEAIEALQRSIASSNRSGSDGIDFDSPLPATITAVNPAAGSDGLVLASAVQYTYQMRDTQITKTGRPEYGRPFDVTGPVASVLKVKPGAVGDRCWVVRRRNPDGTLGESQLWVTSEKLTFAVCTSNPPPSPPGMLPLRERLKTVAPQPSTESAPAATGISPGDGVSE